MAQRREVGSAGIAELTIMTEMLGADIAEVSSTSYGHREQAVVLEGDSAPA